MNMKSGRAYQQTVRAQKAAETEERILEEAERLFSTESFDRVTLAAVAQASGVSIPTLQRGFGNKEGLFAAVGARVRARVMAQRDPAPMPNARDGHDGHDGHDGRDGRGGNDVDGALDALLAHYERDGRMVWHLLKQEAEVPQLRPALTDARALHRAWVKAVFARFLDGDDGAKNDTIDVFYAATDLYLWKLMRLDLGRSRAETERTIKAIVHAAIDRTKRSK